MKTHSNHDEWRLSKLGEKVFLVTGGAGFIGSHLADKLIREGHVVKVFDDFSNADVNNIRALLNYRNFKLIRGDIRNYELLQRVTSDVDVIFHLAAQIHVDKSIISPTSTFEVNTMGTLNILEAAKENDVEKVVYASSSEVYGSAQYVPMDEKHPLNPCSPYAASKVAADRLCFAYHNTYGLNVAIVRHFNTFGPRQKSTGYGGAISIFVRRALEDKPPIIYGDGLQTRDYMYFKDALKAYDLVLNSNNVAGKVINFGSGQEVSMIEVANIIVKLCGKGRKLKPVFVAPRPGEVRRLCADISFAKSLLGFEPQYTLKSGLMEFIDWHREYRYEEWAKPG